MINDEELKELGAEFPDCEILFGQKLADYFTKLQEAEILERRKKAAFVHSHERELYDFMIKEGGRRND